MAALDLLDPVFDGSGTRDSFETACQKLQPKLEMERCDEMNYCGSLSSDSAQNVCGSVWPTPNHTSIFPNIEVSEEVSGPRIPRVVPVGGSAPPNSPIDRQVSSAPWSTSRLQHRTIHQGEPSLFIADSMIVDLRSCGHLDQPHLMVPEPRQQDLSEAECCLLHSEFGSMPVGYNTFFSDPLFPAHCCHCWVTRNT